MKKIDDNMLVKVYDLEPYVLDNLSDENKEKYELHLYKRMAIIHNEAGEGAIVDNEAVGAEFEKLEDSFNIPLYKKETTDAEGNKCIYVSSSVYVSIPISDLLKGCAHQEMTVSEFFDRRNYNFRCSQNFSNLSSVLNRYGISLKKQVIEN